MDKQEIITQVANDILNRLNIGQIVNVLREYSMQQAEGYYQGLSDDQRSELEQKIIEAREQTQPKAKEESTEETLEPASV